MLRRAPSPGFTIVTALGAGLLAAAGFAGLACGGRGADQPVSGPVVHDGLGRAVTLRTPRPSRIVSLAPSATDTLAALGAGARLVGVSDFCHPPPEASGARRIGGLLTPDLETIRSLHPDLLVGSTSGNDPGLASQAASLGLPLYILDAPDVAHVLSGIAGLADAIGDHARGVEVVQGLQARLEVLSRTLAGRPRPRVLFVIWGDPLVVPGARAFLTDALTKAGGQSVTGDVAAAHPTFSAEAAVARAPEVILMTADNREVAERIRTDPAWAGVPAVRTGRVAVVGDEVVRPGPEVVAGIEEMARVIHPEAFENGRESKDADPAVSPRKN
jgi:iron complex transport system substrate-binding protein